MPRQASSQYFKNMRTRISTQLNTQTHSLNAPRLGNSLKKRDKTSTQLTRQSSDWRVLKSFSKQKKEKKRS